MHLFCSGVVPQIGCSAPDRVQCPALLAVVVVPGMWAPSESCLLLGVLCGLVLWFLRNVACNSRLAISNFEFISLELQRVQTLLKVHAIELHAILLSAGPAAHGHCGQGAHAVQSSPCWRQMPQHRPCSVCWESFVPVRPARAANRESFVPGRRIRCAGPVSRNHRNHCGLPVC